MKRVIFIALLAFCFGVFSFAQTEWQGRVAKGGTQDFPAEGYYAATNSFPRNTIVNVTNPTTGKSVRVVVSRGLTDNSLFMTLSADAARALGLDGNFPSTMKAQPVIVPGISDQSIGSELPFNRDPDVNPAAAAGNSTNTAKNMATSSPSGTTTSVAQPPSQSVVQSTGQAASSQQAPAAQPASNTLPLADSSAISLSPASRTSVVPSQGAQDLDLSASTPIAIGPQADALPSEVLVSAARQAITGSPPPAQAASNTAPVLANPALALEAASTMPVSQGEIVADQAGPDVSLAPELQGQAGVPPALDAANLAESRTIPVQAVQPLPASAASNQTLVKAPAQTGAAVTLIPAIQVPVVPASIPPTQQVVRNSLKGSPVVASRDMPATIPGALVPASQASTGSTANLLRANTQPVTVSDTNVAAPALVGLAAASSAPVIATSPASQASSNPGSSPATKAVAGVSGIQAGIQAGAIKNPALASSGGSVSPSAPSSSIQSGASGIGARSLGTDVGNRPGAALVLAPEAAPAPSSKPMMRGLGTGIQSMGASAGDLSALGDVARPEHTFNPPDSKQAVVVDNSLLQVPKTVRSEGSIAQAGSASNADGTSLLDRQLAGVQDRGADRSLFRAGPPDESVAVLPSLKAGKLGDPTLSGLPAASFPGVQGARPEASLPELNKVYPALDANGLPIANAKAAVKPEQPMSGIKAGIAAGVGANLPSANAPGLSRADGSIAGVVPASGTADGSSLPLAQAPGQQTPDSLLAGQKAPGGASVTASLPGVVPSGQSRPDASLAGTRAGVVTVDGNGLPVARLADQSKPESVLTGANPGSTGFDPLTGLPMASAPGLSRADASNPWLEGPIGMNGTEPSLPVARLVPGELPQTALAGVSPGLALVPDKGDLPMVALNVGEVQKPLASGSPANPELVDSGLPEAVAKGQENAEDPLKALRPLDAIASLEPANLKPPVVNLAAADGGLNSSSPTRYGPDGLALTNPQVRTGNGDASLSGSNPAGYGPDGVALVQPLVKNSAGDPSFAGSNPSGLGPDGVALSQPLLRDSSGDPSFSGGNPVQYGPDGIVLTKPQVRIASGDASLAGGNPVQYGPDGLALTQPRLQTNPGDASLAGSSPLQYGPDGVALTAPRVQSDTGDASLAGAAPAASSPASDPALAVAAMPAKTGKEALLAAIRPTQDPVTGDLALPLRNAPDVASSQKNPADGGVSADLAQAKTPESKAVDKGLAGETKAQPGTALAVTPVQPTIPGQKLPANAVNPEASRILSLLDQSAPKAATVTPVKPVTPALTPAQISASVTADEQWAQKNLPLAKKLEKAKYYVQVGAFANPRSAKTAIDEVAKGYPVAVVPESAKDRQIYKVFVGPLDEDEKGLLLYLFRSKGYRDAFIKQGQP